LLKTENVEYTSVYRVDLGSLDYDFVLPNETLKKILYYLDDDATKHFDIYKYKLPDTGDFMTSSELILNTVLDINQFSSELIYTLIHNTNFFNNEGERSELLKKIRYDFKKFYFPIEMYRWDNVLSFGDIICNTANSKLKREYLRRYIFERKELLSEVVSAYSLLKKYREKYNYNIKKLMKNKTLSEFIDIAEKIREENSDSTEFIHPFEFDENEEKKK